MLKLCLFDLDDTLLRTTELKDIREEGVEDTGPEYVQRLTAAVGNPVPRYLYSPDSLARIRTEFPKLKLGVFTRAPRAYVDTVLRLAFPKVDWDVVIAYEDVRRTKPFRDGIWRAMDATGVQYINHVALVGDSDADVRSAYHAGVYAVLDQRGWPQKRERDHWNAIGHMPDAEIKTDAELMEFLRNPLMFVPEMEWRLEQPGKERGRVRFDKVNKFIPDSAGGDKTAYPVVACGRFFTKYRSLDSRRDWHELTKSIKANKASESFPDAWVRTVGFYIRTYLVPQLFASGHIITVVPHRPERPPRLEHFLAQLEGSFANDSARNKLQFVPDLLGYKDGVKSQSGEFLSHHDRFVNVRDHLEVRRPELLAKGRTVLVIDDVTTTGATLIYAKKYLADKGAGTVTCLALAMTVSDVLPKS